MDFHTLPSFPNMVHAAGAWLPAFALKGAAILGMACLANVVLRRASAASRHMVWLLAVAGVLALPLLSTIVPPLRMPASHGPVTVLAAPVRRSISVMAPIAAHGPSAIAVNVHAGDPSVAAAPMTAPSGAPELGFSVRRLPLLLIVLWAVVAGGALLRLGLSMALAGRLTHRCAAVTDPALLAEIQTLTAEAGIRRPVELRQGEAAAVPMTVGLRRPIILLPADAGEWPRPQREAALRHELAHIRRRDWAGHVLAGTFCALHWFNPLAWIAARQMREECERACDDAVLAQGVRPADYAAHLLEVARRLSAPGVIRPGGAVAMANRPQVEDRLRAILSKDSDRRGMTPQRTLLTLTAAGLMLAPVAALRTHTQEPESPSEPAAKSATRKSTSVLASLPRHARLPHSTPVTVREDDAIVVAMGPAPRPLTFLRISSAAPRNTPARPEARTHVARTAYTGAATLSNATSKPYPSHTIDKVAAAPIAKTELQDVAPGPRYPTFKVAAAIPSVETQVSWRLAAITQSTPAITRIAKPTETVQVTTSMNDEPAHSVPFGNIKAAVLSSQSNAVNDKTLSQMLKKAETARIRQFGDHVEYLYIVGNRAAVSSPSKLMAPSEADRAVISFDEPKQSPMDRGKITTLFGHGGGAQIRTSAGVRYFVVDPSEKSADSAGLKPDNSTYRSFNGGNPFTVVVPE